ncbi:MAG: hypothetical protein ACRCX2_28345 [Paraclostridium sp.]
MKEILNVFRPEISPIHKVDFSIAVQLKVAGIKPADTVIPAGTIVKGDFLKDPVAHVAEIATVADADAITGVLMHDISINDGQLADTNYSAGVMIKGVVYGDVMTLANTATNYTDAVQATLTKLGIATYGVKTIGKSR